MTVSFTQYHASGRLLAPAVSARDGVVVPEGVNRTGRPSATPLARISSNARRRIQPSESREESNGARRPRSSAAARLGSDG
jgi:hypothetical protein